MLGRLTDRMLSWIDASLAALGHGFIREWTKVERSYRRPLSQLASRLKFAFYPLLAIGAIAWLGWDWTHTRSLNAAENAIFDRVVQWRPFEPKPSGRVVVVEIDECSIEYFRAKNEGGWPWSRQRHADLLDQLDRAGVRAVGYDVLFADPSQDDPVGDQALEAMAQGGAGRFVFASTRLHADYDEGSPLRASQAPAAFALKPRPQIDPKVALLLPYGAAMARFSAIVNVTRSEDGVLRDLPLRETVGDWALPSLPLRLATTTTPRAPGYLAATVRPRVRALCGVEGQMIGPYKESNKYKLEAEVASLRARCDELNEACSAKQVLIDHTASDLRDMRDLYEREKDTLHAELASARTVERKDLHEQVERLREIVSALVYFVDDADSLANLLCHYPQEAMDASRAALSQPAATGEGHTIQGADGVTRKWYPGTDHDPTCRAITHGGTTCTCPHSP